MRESLRPKALADDLTRFANDPLGFQREYWPGVRFYDKQVEIIESVRDNDETLVGAANMMGKDFAAGFISLWGVCCHKVARVVTTSVRADHLRVLWGEILRFVQSAARPLTADAGGPLVVNHWDIRKVVDGKPCPISYLRGMVSEKGEGLAGHHAPYTLAVIDEASGVPNVTYTQMATWAKRFLVFGNCNPCDPEHFFRKGITEGDLPAD